LPKSRYSAIVTITRQNDPVLLDKTHKDNLAQYDAIQGLSFPGRKAFESMINARFTPAVVKNHDARPFLDPSFVQRTVDRLGTTKTK
jgi:hypothetical protein